MMVLGDRTQGRRSGDTTVTNETITAQQPHLFRVQRGAFDAQVLLKANDAVALREQGWTVWMFLTNCEINLHSSEVAYTCCYCGNRWVEQCYVPAEKRFCAADCAEADALTPSL